MKKILTILGIFGSSAISTTSLLACNTFNGNNFNTSENNKIIKTLKEKINNTLLDNIEDSTKEKQIIKAEAKMIEFQQKCRNHTHFVLLWCLHFYKINFINILNKVLKLCKQSNI